MFYYLSIYRSCPSLSYLLTLEMAPGQAGDPHLQSPEGPDPGQLFPLAGPDPSCQQEYEMVFMHSFHKLVWSTYCVPDTGRGMRGKADKVLICRYQTIIQHIQHISRESCEQGSWKLKSTWQESQVNLAIRESFL